MAGLSGSGVRLGINGLGRIGKLSLWHHVAQKHFGEIVVNLGRPAGTGLSDVAHYVERDSTYGRLQGYLYGQSGRPVITDIDEQKGRMRIDGVNVTFLRSQRNPVNVGWAEHGVKLVVDTTGRFLDPTLLPEHPQGAVRGHLAGGAEKVVVSAPFTLKDKARPMTADAVTTIMGVNGNNYDPRRHRIVSCASCTTTCLAHMMRPLINAFGAKRILSASMATVHAATSSQEVLDRLPEAGKTDLRKSCSIMNNIILTSTGATNALPLVIPEMKDILSIAESVRIPTCTGSFIILVVNLQEEPTAGRIDRTAINAIYRQAAADSSEGYLLYSENVAADIIGMPRAAAIIEGCKTHTRTAKASMDLSKVPGMPSELVTSLKDMVIRIPVTQAVIYGWYDNEMGSYVRLLGDCVVTIAKKETTQKKSLEKATCDAQTKKDMKTTSLRKTMKISETYIQEMGITIGPIKVNWKKAPREVEMVANKSGSSPG